jgi:hypothetical protein
MLVRKEDLLQEKIREAAPWLSLDIHLRVRFIVTKNGLVIGRGFAHRRHDPGEPV